jgi:hypothetical protein
MHARRGTAQRTVLLVGRDLHEAERVRRLLPARVGIAHAPSQALCALAGADLVLLEDRSWPQAEDDALRILRELTGARRLALILSRHRGERGEEAGVPVVERPYRIEELMAAMRLALLRKRA